MADTELFIFQNLSFDHTQTFWGHIQEQGNIFLRRCFHKFRFSVDQPAQSFFCRNTQHLFMLLMFL